MDIPRIPMLRLYPGLSKRKDISCLRAGPVYKGVKMTQLKVFQMWSAGVKKESNIKIIK
jgi:hypothetical protein